MQGQAVVFVSFSTVCLPWNPILHPRGGALHLIHATKPIAKQTGEIKRILYFHDDQGRRCHVVIEGDREAVEEMFSELTARHDFEGVG